MDNVALEIVIISAEDLKDVRSFGRPMRTFVTVWTDSSNQTSTRVDREGGTYPCWNDKFQMHVSRHYLQQSGSSMLIQIYCKTMLGIKKVGFARMPYSDVLEGYGSPDSIHFLSYRVTSRSGKRRGTIDLSIRFLEKINSCSRISTADMKFPAFSFKSRKQASSSYGKRPQWQHNHNNGHAIGIPLSTMQQSQFTYPQQQHIAANYSALTTPSRFRPQHSIY